MILGGLGEVGGGGGLPAAYRQGSQLCHCDSVARGQGSSRAAVPTASSTGTIWARPCPAFPLGHSGLISNNFLLPQAGNTPPTQALLGVSLTWVGAQVSIWSQCPSWLSPLPAAPPTFLPTFLDLALPLAWGGLGFFSDTSSQTFPRACPSWSQWSVGISCALEHDLKVSSGPAQGSTLHSRLLPVA